MHSFVSQSTTLLASKRDGRGVPAHRGRRGIAMLLVLISLMMATILTTAYLASRDNSTTIGDNVASAAAARWAADSGLDFSIAILETESAWRTSHVNGRLLSNYPLAGGTVNVDLVDLETGLAPTSSSEYVRMTSTALVDGVNQTSIADCRVPLTTGDVVDVDLSEFAVFASQKLTMTNKATIARWPMAPLSKLGTRVLMGTQATSAASMMLSDDSAAVDTTVFHGPGASNTLVTVANSQPPESASWLDNVPMPASPSTGVTAPLAVSLSPNLTQASGSAITNANTRWKNVTLSNNSVRTLRGNITAITDEDLNISSGAKLVIDGKVKLVVFGDTIMDQGSIELKPGATLTMFVRGRTATAMNLKDGFIGELRSTGNRDASGKAPYMDPERVLIFSTPAASATQWKADKNTVIKASLYAPDPTAVTLNKQSAVYGRIATKQLAMTDDAALFYDPGLNDLAGYTPAGGAMWDTSSRLKNEFKTLASLDASALQAVADVAGTVVFSLTKSTSNYTPTSTAATTPDAVAPTDPTPRPIAVDYTVVTFGNALDSWE